MKFVLSDQSYKLLTLKDQEYSLITSSKAAVIELFAKGNAEWLRKYSVDFLIVDISLNTLYEMFDILRISSTDPNHNIRLFKKLSSALAHLTEMVQHTCPNAKLLLVERPLYISRSLQISIGLSPISDRIFVHPISDLCWSIFKAKFQDFENVMTTAYNGMISLDGSSVANYYRTDSFLNYKNLPLILKELADAWLLMNAKPFKAIILDLDNTLWHGILLEDGIENLIIGGVSPRGKLYFTLQEFFKFLKQKGILLVAVSKNSRKDVIKALDTIDSPLSSDDFCVIAASMQRKSVSIAHLEKLLNISLADMIFIDDNYHERAEVSQSLPTVTVLDLPNNKMQWLDKLSSNKRLTKTWLKASITDSIDRTKSYRERASRSDTMLNISNTYTNSDWLKSLQQIIKCKEVYCVTSRIEELFVRVNQFNLNASNLSRPMLTDLLANGYRLTQYSVQDKHGSDGVVAVTVTYENDSYLELHEMLLSCRVFNRNIEHSILMYILKKSRTLALSGVRCFFSEQPSNTASTVFIKRYVDQEGLVLPDNLILDYTDDVISEQ